MQVLEGLFSILRCRTGDLRRDKQRRRRRDVVWLRISTCSERQVSETHRAQQPLKHILGQPAS